MISPIRAAVIGHTEWIDFVRVAHLPRAGEIIHGTEAWSEPGGGGAVAAVQLAKLAGGAQFLTALGDDEIGHRMHRDLTELGVDVCAAVNAEAQRRAIVFIDDHGERTITVLGTRLSPTGRDPLPWRELEGTDVIYLTAGDVEAVHYARRARVLVATSRVLPLLGSANVKLDALVGSALDPSERYSDGDLPIRPRLVVRTAGRAGGTFQVEGEAEQSFPAAPLPGTIKDFYGCGDSFAAGLTFGLGLGYSPREAIDLAARCGAAVATGRGPFEAQLTLEQFCSTERR
ncbi:MAG: PfkB family carbohydrate kinase [Actinomycetota bacterium]